MRRIVLAIVFWALIASCGGETADPGGGGASDLPDPCQLADDSILTSYFGEVFDGEPGEVGPLLTCRWSDANANSLLIQVANDYSLNRPDPCRDCVDLAFADDGYATESLLQSSAKFVAGSTFVSVTTTGFGDDLESMAALAEQLYDNAGL